MKKLLSALIASLLIASQAGAYSPFDIVLRNAADLAASDIYQDIASKDLYIKVCNVGGSMQESGDLLMGIKKSNGTTVTDTINGVTLQGGACRDFRVSTASKLGIVGTENTSFTAAIKLTKGKKESNLINNKLTKYLTVYSASTYTPPVNPNPWNPWNPTPTYGTADFVVQNIRYVSSINAYRESSTTTVYNAFAVDVCNFGDSVSFSQNFQIRMSANGETEYQNIQPYTNNSNTWSRYDCKTFAFETSKFKIWNTNNSYSVSVEANTGYNRINESNTTNNSLQSTVWTNGSGNTPTGNFSIRVLAPNGGERYSVNNTSNLTVRGEVSSYNRTLDWIDVEVYKRNSNSDWNETLYTTERINNPSYSNWNSTYTIDRSLGISNWGDGDYRIKLVAKDSYGNTTSDWSDGTFKIESGNGKADLVVRSIYQQDYEKRIITQICNDGASMNKNVSIRNEISNSNYRSVTKYINIRLDKDQCTTELTATPDELGIVSAGTYSITVRLDTERSVEQYNTGNDTKTTEIYVSNSGFNRVDLVLENISQDYSSRNITARICNRGNDMYNSESLNIQWYNSNNGMTSTQYVTARLTSGQCVDSTTSPQAIGIYQEGYVTLRATVDPNGSINDANRDNNSRTQGLYIRY